MITFHRYDFYPFNNTYVTTKFLMLCVSVLQHSKKKKYMTHTLKNIDDTPMTKND